MSFRTSGNTKMRNDQVGVGSLIKGSHATGDWIIISNREETHVNLLSQKTYTIVNKENVKVEDIHFISVIEAQALCKNISDQLMWTFSDFDFNTRGVKNL